MISRNQQSFPRECDASEPKSVKHGLVLDGHKGAVAAVAISPDNRWLVTSGDDKTARIWPLQINRLIDLARVTVGRNFTKEEWKLYFSGEKYRKTFDELPSPDEIVTQKKQLGSSKFFPCVTLGKEKCL
jgi:WD40 repeat protein